jgi:hypothetical protein
VFASPWLACVVVPGRLLAAAVELWVVQRHLSGLLHEDISAAAAARQQGRAGLQQ